MKPCKLIVHQKNFSDENLILNPKDFPFINAGDIVEIYLVEDEFSRLLLQVTNLHEDFPQKDAISIEQSIATSFQLRAFAEVIVRVVQPKDVALDSVELTFKDQYLARSDMWLLKRALVNSCVYLNKKIEQSTIRCQVYEMWAQGERVACGVVTEDTKLVFRSASSMVYLFIQMSAEMWDFDIAGDLYFEKAVNGFLSDLFTKWKKLNCNHDVTIVLFSRTYYEAQNLDEFPSGMRECLRQDHRGRFYEDFYRVAVQNERYEDWSGCLTLLKKLFNQYLLNVLNYHSYPGVVLPHAVNSTSSQGNFLEVLNMSLNVFEKHYMDRSFDRTGQLSVVLSPGVGVFEVDRELANITKQRIIDNGIGSDLVCLGEQPLHAVPLFKFHNKVTHGLDPSCEVDDYNMPHWINLSFYSSAKCINVSSFVPRIKLPTPLPITEREKLRESGRNSLRCRHVSQPEHSFPSVFDYDEYDSQVFKLPAHAQNNWPTYSLQHSGGLRRKSTVVRPRPSQHRLSEDNSASHFLTNSEPAPTNTGSLPVRSDAISIPQRNCSMIDSSLAAAAGVSAEPGSEASVRRTPSREENDGSEFTPPARAIIGSAGCSPYEHLTSKQTIRRPRALVNPFDPSHVTIKLTSNRRRWTHIFPLGPTGIFMQQHHYQAIPQNTAATLMPTSTLESGLRASRELLNYLVGGRTDMEPSEERKRSEPKGPSKLSIPLSVNGSCANEGHCRPMVVRSTTLPSADPHTNRNLTWLWGATGEQEWTPALTTGVDWKSLVIPACLPMTTDYFPDKTSLDKDYVVTIYSLLPEDIRIDLSMHRSYRGEDDAQQHDAFSTLHIFEELVCQRLQQSFQVILFPKQHPYYLSQHSQSTSSPQFAPAIGRSYQAQHCEEVHLSIGRIFHKLALEGSKITVTQYRPKHPYPALEIHYCYRFRAPDNETYGVSWVDFVSEKLETFNWNHLDHYICQRGDGEFELKETLKYWRLRLVLLPSAGQASTRCIIEGKPNQRCDIYAQPSTEEVTSQREGILKFLEIVNRVRRPVASRKNIKSGGGHARRFSLGQSSVSPQVFGAAGFRDRVGSTGTHLTRHPRSSKVVDRLRSSDRLTSSGRVSPAAEADLKSLLDHGFVCHASRVKHPFVNGFYLYYLTEKENVSGGDSRQDAEDLEMFQKEWLEVEVPLTDDIITASSNTSWEADFSADDSDSEENDLQFKRANLDIQAGSKTARAEWGHLRYHSHFQPYTAFEFVLEWMVATGNIIADLVGNRWSRKTGGCGLHLVPIPSDPFALPFSSKSDPLRGPIYIPLNLYCLAGEASLHEQGLVAFQERILQAFGFIPHFDPCGQMQYIHMSGSMFVLLPSRFREALVPLVKRRITREDLPVVCSPHEQYISQHFIRLRDQENASPDPAAKVGFLFSWNYMMTKRWKTAATGEESFMRKVMWDFRSFCANDNNRLADFYNQHFLEGFSDNIWTTD